MKIKAFFLSLALLSLTACSTWKGLSRSSSPSPLFDNISLDNALALKRRMAVAKGNGSSRKLASSGDFSLNEAIENRFIGKDCASGFDVTPYIKGFVDDDAKSILEEHEDEFKHYLETGRIPLSGGEKNAPQVVWCATFAESYGQALTEGLSEKWGGVFDQALKVARPQGFTSQGFFAKGKARLEACRPYIDVDAIDLFKKTLGSYEQESEPGDKEKMQLVRLLQSSGTSLLSDGYKSNPKAINCESLALGHIQGNITALALIAFAEALPEAFSQVVETMAEGIGEGLKKGINRSLQVR